MHLPGSWIVFAMLFMAAIEGRSQSPDSTPVLHCIPLAESRKLHEDAVKSYQYKALADSLQGKVIVLEEEKSAENERFNALLNQEREKTAIQAELKDHQKALNDTYIIECQTCQKQDKRHRHQRNALGLALIVVIILAL